jgi:hypothetical protein
MDCVLYGLFVASMSHMALKPKGEGGRTIRSERLGGEGLEAREVLRRSLLSSEVCGTSKDGANLSSREVHIRAHAGGW